MPRVHKRTKSTRGKYEYRCRGCGQKIEPGQDFYQWEKRYGGPQRRHVACGYPRPSELSGRKTAVVEDAIQDAQGELGKVTAALPVEWDIDSDGTEFDLTDVVEEIRGLLEPVADEAESVGDEYESSADNMPESLQYGSQAEAMRDVADRLREWAEDLRSWEPSENEHADLPDADKESEDWDEEAWLSDANDAVENAVSALTDEASTALDDLPEYEG